MIFFVVTAGRSNATIIRLNREKERGKKRKKKEKNVDLARIIKLRAARSCETTKNSRYHYSPCPVPLGFSYSFCSFFLVLLTPLRSALLLLLTTHSGDLYMPDEGLLVSSLWSDLNHLETWKSFSNTVPVVDGERCIVWNTDWIPQLPVKNKFEWRDRTYLHGYKPCTG